MLMILLSFTFFSSGRKARVTSNSAKKFTSITFLQALEGIQSMQPELAIPALFTTVHTRAFLNLASSSVFCTRFLMSASFVTSHCTGSATTPRRDSTLCACRHAATTR
jgi:hypothetical protein